MHETKREREMGRKRESESWLVGIVGSVLGRGLLPPEMAISTAFVFPIGCKSRICTLNKHFIFVFTFILDTRYSILEVVY